MNLPFEAVLKIVLARMECLTQPSTVEPKMINRNFPIKIFKNVRQNEQHSQCCKMGS